MIPDKNPSRTSMPSSVRPSNEDSTARCGLCGKTENLTRTECCGNWICDDKQSDKPLSFAHNSCHHNHRLLTVCGQHHAEQHDGPWQNCDVCRAATTAESYAYYATNEYNFEVLSDPPPFEPTRCFTCGRTISLVRETYSIRDGKYECGECFRRYLGETNTVNESSTSDPASLMNMEEMVDSDIAEVLRQLQEGVNLLPVEAIRRIQSAIPLFINPLIESIEKATDAVASGKSAEGNLHFFALFLLTESRAWAAWPAIRRAIFLPGEGAFEIFGDAASGCLHRVTAVFLADSVDELDELICNHDLNEYVRWGACSTYLLWVRDGRMTREEAVLRMRRLLTHFMKCQDSFMVTALACEMLAFTDTDPIEELREAFDQDLVDETTICWGNFEEAFKDGSEYFQKRIKTCPPTGFPDIIGELSGWSSFSSSYSADTEKPDDWYPEEKPDDRHPEYDSDPIPDPLIAPQGSATIRNAGPKVGRNDPCPCGSGKKYKKCCG